MKKFALILVFALIFTGFISANAEALEIGYVTGNMGSEINVVAYEAFEEFAEEKGWDVRLADNQGDTTLFNENMINFVNVGVDAIVVFSGEDALIREGERVAREEGIPVFLADTENVGDTIVNVTSNNWAMGALLGSQIVDRLNLMEKDEYNVALIGMPDLYVHRQRFDMLKSVFESEENDNIEVVATEGVHSDNWENASYDIATTWITSYGDDIDAIIGTWDGIGWGISRAIADAGYSNDEIFTMSVDGVEETLNMIRNDEPFVGVVAQDFGAWVEVVGQAIEKVVINDEDPDEFIPDTRTIYVPHTWIDSSNVPEPGETVKFQPFNPFEN